MLLHDFLPLRVFDLDVKSNGPDGRLVKQILLLLHHSLEVGHVRMDPPQHIALILAEFLRLVSQFLDPILRSVVARAEMSNALSQRRHLLLHPSDVRRRLIQIPLLCGELLLRLVDDAPQRGVLSLRLLFDGHALGVDALFESPL